MKSAVRIVYAPAEISAAPPARAAVADDRRIPSLDGLRALSIGLVLLDHSNGAGGLPVVMLPLGDYANLGVRVFFVISGYLISSLLFRELGKTERVDLKEFYLRRVFRIFPAFYAFLAAVAIATAVGLIAVPPVDLALAATYSINFVAHKAWSVGHIWSLSVEEQFYLIWPATLALLGRKRGLHVAFGVLCAGPLARMSWFYLWPEQQTLITEAFPTVADAIAVGCLLAGLRERLAASPRYLAALRSRWFWLLPVLMVAVNAQPFHRLRWLAGETFLNIAIAIVIDRFIRFPHSLSGRVLNHRAVAFVGTLSYSLYLWQQLFISRSLDAPWTRFPANIFCTVALALGSYYLVEKPMLALRQRLQSRARRAIPTPAPQLRDSA